MKKIFFLLILICLVAQPIEAKKKQRSTTAVINNQIKAIYRSAWGNLNYVERRYLTQDFLSMVQQRNAQYENEYVEDWDAPYPEFVETFCLNVGDAPVTPKLSPKVDNIVMTDDTHAVAHVRVNYVGLGTTDYVSLKFVLSNGQWKVCDIIRDGYSLFSSLSGSDELPQQPEPQQRNLNYERLRESGNRVF